VADNEEVENKFTVMARLAILAYLKQNRKDVRWFEGMDGWGG